MPLKSSSDSFIVYTDNGFSGLTLDRPAFNALQADIQVRRVGTVVVLDVARIECNPTLAPFGPVMTYELLAIFQALSAEAGYENLSIDSTAIGAHQHSAGAKKSCKS